MEDCKSMKKLLVIFLCLIFVCSFVSCDKESKDITPEKAQNTTQEPSKTNPQKQEKSEKSEACYWIFLHEK